MDSKSKIKLPQETIVSKPESLPKESFNDESDSIMICDGSISGDWLVILADCPVAMENLRPRRRDFARPAII